MNTKHTPGPWLVQEMPRQSDRITPDDGEGTTICEFPYGAWDTPEVEANARLIASAPDLLEALYKILNDPVLDSDTQRLLRAHKVARAAIAKAIGDMP